MEEETDLGMSPRDNRDLEHVRVRAQRRLARQARDVLAATDDDVLPAICSARSGSTPEKRKEEARTGNVERTIGEPDGEVARVEVATRERFCGRLRVLVVSLPPFRSHQCRLLKPMQ